MNKKQNFDNIQTVLAILITNSCMVENLPLEANKILNRFRLKLKDKNELKLFFKKHHKQFIASSLLLKKKRWDDIQNSLHLIRKIFEKSNLDDFFEKYLRQIHYRESVPKNPLVESVIFCKYLIESGCCKDSVKTEIINYEILRNSVIINFISDDTKYIHHHLMTEQLGNLDLNRNVFFIHPSAKIAHFNFNVSAYVQEIANEEKVLKFKTEYISEIQSLLFYKNWIKGGASVIKLNKLIEKIFDAVFQFKVISLETILQNDWPYSADFIKKALLSLAKCGLIAVVPKAIVQTKSFQKEVNYV